MKSITSRDNALYKELKQLATSSQARRKAGRTLLDGVHLCETYLNQVGTPVLCVAGEGSLSDPEVAAIVNRCDAAHTRCVVLSDSLYHPLSQVENGPALLFVVNTPHAALPAQLTESAVLLDNVQDPGNLGSILRSAAAAGVRHIICGQGTAFAWSPKVLRAGMGAHFLLNIVEHADLEAVIAGARVPVLATSSHAARRIYDVNLRRPAAWLFGHEGQGVSERLLAKASEQVAIPHAGDMESLNVAACAAVCLFEQLRQRLADTAAGAAHSA